MSTDIELAHSHEGKSQTPTYVDLYSEYFSVVKKVCLQYGPLSLFCVELLATLSERGWWAPKDINTIAKTCLNSPQWIHWTM